MDAMEAILSRRSIRKYSTQPIPADLTEDLMRAAMAAPSANNQQPWQFVVVNDRDLLDRIPDIHPYAKMAARAPLAIFVCGDLDAATLGQYWAQDCAAATQNLLIAITARGLGGVWCGVYPREERVRSFQELLKLPPHIIPFALIVAGCPDESKPPADRYDPRRVHQNGW